MGFKEFYTLNVEKYIFESTFDNYYNKGYFGDNEKEMVREHQREWYKKFIKIINERNEVELVQTLLNTESKLTREWFSLLTGYNIKYTTKQKALLIVKEFIYGQQKQS